jgi:hypothetical protein
LTELIDALQRAQSKIDYWDMEAKR